MYGCTDSIDWKGDGYSNSDCLAVIQRFFFVEVVEHGQKEFEFLSPGASGTSGLPTMQTPRRYTVGEYVGTGDGIRDR